MQPMQPPVNASIETNSVVEMEDDSGEMLITIDGQLQQQQQSAATPPPLPPPLISSSQHGPSGILRRALSNPPSDNPKNKSYTTSSSASPTPPSLSLASASLQPPAVLPRPIPTSADAPFRLPPPLEALSAFTKNNLGKFPPRGSSTTGALHPQQHPPQHPPLGPNYPYKSTSLNTSTKMVSILKPKPTPSIVPSAAGYGGVSGGVSGGGASSSSSAAPVAFGATSAGNALATHSLAPGIKGFACHACADECSSIVALMMHHFNTHMTYR